MRIDMNWVSVVQAGDTAYCLAEPLLVTGYEIRNHTRDVARKVTRLGTPVAIRIARGRGRPKKATA